MKEDCVDISPHSCGKEFEFDKNSFIFVTHNSVGLHHLQMLINRVGFEVNILSDSNKYKKIADC